MSEEFVFHIFRIPRTIHNHICCIYFLGPVGLYHFPPITCAQEWEWLILARRNNGSHMPRQHLEATTTRADLDHCCHCPRNFIFTLQCQYKFRLETVMINSDYILHHFQSLVARLWITTQVCRLANCNFTVRTELKDWFLWEISCCLRLYICFSL